MRTGLLFTLLFGVCIAVLHLRTPETDERVDIEQLPDIVSGATPMYLPPPQHYAMPKEESLRVAAEVVAQLVLRGGLQHLKRTDEEGVGILDKNKSGDWAPHDREYGFGTPAVQWVLDGVPVDKETAPRALSALLARKVADILWTDDGPGFDPVTGAELQPMLCEMRQALRPKEKYVACIQGTLPAKDRDLDAAMKCATAIVGRNAAQIQALAQAYGRDLTQTVFDTFDPLSYSEVVDRKGPAPCAEHACGTMVHEAVLKEHPLDMLTANRRGLPSFCSGRPPVTYKSALRGERPKRDVWAPPKSGALVFTGMLARGIVSDYVLRWDLAKMAETPDSDAVSEYVSSLAAKYGPVNPPDLDMSPILPERMFAVTASKYAGVMGEGAVYRGGLFDTVASRYELDRGVCILTRHMALGHEAAMRGYRGRLAVLWKQRCSAWAAGVPRILMPEIARPAAKLLRQLETCAIALNDANVMQIDMLTAVLNQKFDEKVKEVGPKADVYQLRITMGEVFRLFEHDPPTQPKACEKIPPDSVVLPP